LFSFAQVPPLGKNVVNPDNTKQLFSFAQVPLIGKNVVNPDNTKQLFSFAQVPPLGKNVVNPSIYLTINPFFCSGSPLREKRS